VVKAIIFDFGNTLLFPKDKSYKGKLNPLHKELSKKDGYKFWDHFKLNNELLNFLRNLSMKCDMYIFTTGKIQETPEVRQKIAPIFKNVFSAEKMGFKKDDPQAYAYITQQIGKTPSDTLFIDDSPNNLQAAKAVGLTTLQYKSNKELIMAISALLK
jgi:putative hydrolase of the HAD superfamily